MSDVRMSQRTAAGSGRSQLRSEVSLRSEAKREARLRRAEGRLIAAGYARVSTEMQQDGVSLDAQADAIERAVAEHGWTLDSVVREQASAKAIRTRPKLRALISALDRGELDVLAVSKLDRLSRSNRDFYVLLDQAKRRGWAVVCLDPPLDMTTPAGQMVAGMSMLFAEYERAMIGQRVKDSIEARKRAGTYRPPAKQVGEDAEARIAYLSQEGMGARRIARQLEIEGFLPPVGGTWYPTSVARIARRLQEA